MVVCGGSGGGFAGTGGVCWCVLVCGGGGGGVWWYC